MTKLQAAAALLILACSTTATRAQTTPDTLRLPDIVVSATRVPMSVERLPVPVTVLTGDELRTRGIRTVAEALRTVPSAAVVKSGGSGAQMSVFLRGGESDYVKVFVDGVALNEMGGAVDLADLSTDQVERIEVVRGPVSVLYGSDAVTGSIHVFTRTGAGSASLTVTALGGRGERVDRDDADFAGLPAADAERAAADRDYATYDLDATLAGRAGALSYALGGARSWSGGAYALNNERGSNTGTLRLGWIPAAGSELDLSVRYTDSESGFPTDGSGAIVDANALLDRRQLTASLDAGHRLGDAADLRLQLGLVTRDQTALDRPDGPADTLGVYASTLASELDRRTADLRADFSVPTGVATVGVAAEWADAASSYDSQSSFGPYAASASWDRSNRGYYAQVLSQPLAGLDLTAGGRVDDNDSFGTFETWRLGASLRATPSTRLRGALGTAFRAPTFGESFGSGFGDLGNPDLVPETSRSWEVGVEQEVGGSGLSGSTRDAASVGPGIAGSGIVATIGATWFDQSFRDLVQFTFSPPNPDDPNYFNVGEAESKGLELTGEVAAGGVALSGSYTRLWTEVLDPGLATDAGFVQGQPLLRRPAHSGSLAASYGTTGGAVSLTLNIVGERDDLNFSAFPASRVTLDRYTTLDLATDYDAPWAGPATELLLRVENALDSEYTAIAGFPGIGRVVRLGARVRVGR